MSINNLTIKTIYTDVDEFYKFSTVGTSSIPRAYIGSLVCLASSDRTRVTRQGRLRCTNMIEPHGVHSEKCLVESTKFWLVQLQNLVIIRTTKFLVEQTKFLG